MNALRNKTKPSFPPNETPLKICTTVFPMTQFIQTLNNDGTTTKPCGTPVATAKYTDDAPPNKTAFYERQKAIVSRQ